MNNFWKGVIIVSPIALAAILIYGKKSIATNVSGLGKVNNKKYITIEMQKIDFETGKVKNYIATVQNEEDKNHKIYSLTYGGYRSEWIESISK